MRNDKFELLGTVICVGGAFLLTRDVGSEKAEKFETNIQLGDLYAAISLIFFAFFLINN